MAGQRAVHRGTADAKAPRDLRRAQLLLDAQALDLGGTDRRFATMAGAAHLGGGNPLKLALAPEVGFEFREHAQHVQERLARRAAAVDGLLGRLGSDAALLHRVHDILEVFDAAGEAIDPRHDQRVAAPGPIGCTRTVQSSTGTSAFCQGGHGATDSTSMQIDTIILKTSRFTLTPPGIGDADAMLGYYQRNRLNFQPWEPKRDESFFIAQSVRTRILAMNEMMARQQSLHLLLREPESAEVIGECGFTNIVRGPFQACYLGFSICQRYQGQGLMYEGLRCAIDFVFGELALHRVMANYRPENERSHQLLRRLGEYSHQLCQGFAS